MHWSISNSMEKLAMFCKLLWSLKLPEKVCMSVNYVLTATCRGSGLRSRLLKAGHAVGLHSLKEVPFCSGGLLCVALPGCAPCSVFPVLPSGGVLTSSDSGDSPSNLSSFGSGCSDSAWTSWGSIDSSCCARSSASFLALSSASEVIWSMGVV